MTNPSIDEIDEILKSFVASFVNNESFLPPTQARVLEAKAALTAYINLEVVKGRIDELENLKMQTLETTSPDAFITDTGVAQSIRVHTNSLIEYRLAALHSPKRYGRE